MSEFHPPVPHSITVRLTRDPDAVVVQYIASSKFTFGHDGEFHFKKLSFWKPGDWFYVRFISRLAVLLC